MLVKVLLWLLPGKHISEAFFEKHARASCLARQFDELPCTVFSSFTQAMAFKKSSLIARQIYQEFAVGAFMLLVTCHMPCQALRSRRWLCCMVSQWQVSCHANSRLLSNVCEEVLSRTLSFLESVCAG